MVLLIASLISVLSLPAWAQGTGPSYEVGIVYYTLEGNFKAFDKEVASQSGRSSYSARIKGAHATVRLRADQPQLFRVCGVDPSRYKLYRFRSDGKTRTVTIAKNNMWIGGSKVVLGESEIPMKIQTAESGCFTLTPQSNLGDGEFGFSPLESMDAFMFGVGDVQNSR
jgi:hypothetical protein